MLCCVNVCGIVDVDKCLDSAYSLTACLMMFVTLSLSLARLFMESLRRKTILPFLVYLTFSFRVESELGEREGKDANIKTNFFLPFHPSIFMCRYRIIALVSVVEKNHQGIHYKMKYVLDPKTDNYVRYYLDNPNFFIIVCVILIFQD